MVSYTWVFARPCMALRPPLPTRAQIVLEYEAHKIHYTIRSKH